MIQMPIATIYPNPGFSPIVRYEIMEDLCATMFLCIYWRCFLAAWIRSLPVFVPYFLMKWWIKIIASWMFNSYGLKSAMSWKILERIATGISMIQPLFCSWCENVTTQVVIIHHPFLVILGYPYKDISPIDSHRYIPVIFLLGFLGPRDPTFFTKVVALGRQATQLSGAALAQLERYTLEGLKVDQEARAKMGRGWKMLGFSTVLTCFNHSKLHRTSLGSGRVRDYGRILSCDNYGISYNGISESCGRLVMNRPKLGDKLDDFSNPFFCTQQGYG